jgi:hypothetical protein
MICVNIFMVSNCFFSTIESSEPKRHRAMPQAFQISPKKTSGSCCPIIVRGSLAGNFQARNSIAPLPLGQGNRLIKVMLIKPMTASYASALTASDFNPLFLSSGRSSTVAGEFASAIFTMPPGKNIRTEIKKTLRNPGRRNFMG